MHPFYETPTRIKTTSGHLTAANKRVLVEMHRRGLTDAETPRITYHVTSNGKDEYKVKTEEKGKDDWGKPVVNKYTATYRIV